MNARTEEIAFIALGSNLGDSAELVRRAFDRLKTLTPVPLLCSSLWHSTPVDCPADSPLFINAAAGLFPKPGETPLSLLRQLQFIENEFGRRRGPVINSPRTLDLDLIAFGSRELHTPELTLPHPRAHTRRFVLQPLAEIAPEFVLPRQHHTVAELLRALSNDESMMMV